MHKGSCNCGAISFTVEGELHGPDACHCTQCRKMSGHYWVSTDIAREAIAIAGEDKVGWYQSSERVRRGFCSVCGSALFWDAAGRKKLGVAMGAFDKPTHTRIALHIYVADKGDYYDIADDAPQYEQVPPHP